MSFESKHEENRLKVCAPCGKKIVFSNDQCFYIINKKFEDLIKMHVNENFEVSDSRFPSGICGTCRRTLNDYGNGKSKRNLPSMPNYVDIILPKETRANEDSCNCYICLTARFKGHANIQRGKGHKNESVKITAENGLHGNLKNVSLPKKAQANDNTRSSISICNLCFQEIGRGKSHPCIKSVKPRDNALKFVDKLPEEQKEQVVSSILRKKIDSSSNSNDSSTSSHQNKSLQLSTMGRQLRVTVNPVENKPIVFTTESLDNYHANTGSSSKEMKKMTNFLRSIAGKKSVPPYYLKHVSERTKTLDNIYKSDVCEFDVANSNLQKCRRPVVWADAEEILEFVSQKRGIIGNVLVKMMIDGGQHFLKICLTIFVRAASPEVKRRSLYSEGGTCAKKAKLTSVKRLILLAIVPDVKESYENIQLLFNLTNVNNISFKLVTDFKLLLIIIGQQTVTAMYPCPYCFISLNELKANEEDIATDSEEDDEHNAEPECLKVSSTCLRLKTYGDLKNDHDQFVLAGGNKKLAMQNHSTINKPLLEEEDDILVIEKCVIPELHVLQGFVNHLFWNGLVPLLTKKKALLWPKKLHICSKNYHGDTFEGNACRKLLQESDALNDPQIYSNVGKFALVPFIAAFKAMNKIVDCCFSTSLPGPNLDEYVKELKNAHKTTGVSVPLKIHVIFEHLRHSLHFLNGDGFGLWSEQAGESVHRDFLNVWNRHKINVIDEPSYQNKLKNAVVEYSSLHI